MPAVVLMMTSTSAGADPLHGLAVERHLARALARLGIAHVDVHDGRARTRRGDAGLGDLLRGHRHVLGAADGVAGAGEGAGDHDLAVHRVLHGAASCSVVLGCRSDATAARGEGDGRPEIAEVAVLPVDEDVVVGPLRGLHDDHVEVAVDVRELAAAAVGGRPPSGGVQRPPVVAEAGVRGDAAGQPAGLDERVRRARAAGAPSPGRAPARRRRCRRAARSPTRAQSRAVAARLPPAIGDARGVDADEGVATCSRGRATARRAPSAYGAPVARSRTQSRTCESAVQYSQRVPGATAGRPRPAARASSPPPAAEAGEQPAGQAGRVAVVLDPVDAGGHGQHVAHGARRRSRCRPARARGRRRGRRGASAPAAHGDADQVGERGLGHRGAEEAGRRGRVPRRTTRARPARAAARPARCRG